MALDLTRPLPPRSHAWCSEDTCAWSLAGSDCHVQARAHSDALHHIVHVYEADPVDRAH